MKSKLKCGVCGEKVQSEGLNLMRTCEHQDAAVVIEMSSVMQGAGTADSPQDTQGLDAILASVKR